MKRQIITRAGLPNRVRSALRLIAGIGCSNNYTGNIRCWMRGRKRSAKNTAERWCDACIAKDALNSMRKRK